MSSIREKIILELYNNSLQGGKGLSEPELISLLGKKKGAKPISKELQAMKQYKTLNYSKLRYSLNNVQRYHEGTVVKVAGGHGFILLNDSEEGEEVFVRLTRNLRNGLNSSRSFKTISAFDRSSESRVRL